MTVPIISTKNLTRRFGEKIAVDKLNLEVFPGQVFGFLGHNGAGKTTTVRLLNGILNPTEGEVRVLGVVPVQNGPELRLRTGVLTETPSLEERLTARENLSLFAEMYQVPSSEIRKRVEETLALFEILEHADEKAGRYSKGVNYHPVELGGL